MPGRCNQHRTPTWHLENMTHNPGLCDEIVDDVTCQISQSIIATAIVVGEPGMVDAKLVKNRRVDVVHMHGILNRLPSEIVGGSVGESPLESAAGKPHGESVGIVVPPVMRLAAHEGAPDFNNWRTPEL